MHARDVPFATNRLNRKGTRAAIRGTGLRVARARQIVINWMSERLGLRGNDEYDWEIAPSREDRQDLRLKHSSWYLWRLIASERSHS